MKFPSWLPCWPVWNLTFWTHASLSWRCMNANPWKFRQALVYSRISLFLINFSHNAQKSPQTAQKILGNQTVGAVCLWHWFERWELLTWYLIFFSYADGFSFNLRSLESQKNTIFFTSKISTSPLFLGNFILLRLWYFLYLVSWLHYKAISHLSLVKLLYKLGLSVFHTSFHKSAA